MKAYKDHLIDVKTYPLRDGPEWTSHVHIYRDHRDGIELVIKIEMANRYATSQEAFDASMWKALETIDSL